MDSNYHIKKIRDIQEQAVNNSKLLCIKKYGPNLQSNDPIFDKITQRVMCPPYFDTVYCWPPQLANTTASVACPHYMVGFRETHNATRRCMENGQWFSKDGENTFSNYTDCSPDRYTTVYTNISDNSQVDDLTNSVKLIRLFNETGYTVSLISLLIAFTIMFKIKKLHCARNILHMNLFASFILKSFMHILKDALFEDGLTLSKDLLVDGNGSTFFHVDSRVNNFECKTIVSLSQYFAIANVSWILMEGIYLNNLILRALFTDSSKSLAYYISFGWGLPILVIIPWAVARVLVEDTLCWTTHDNIRVFLIIIIPTFTAVLLNLVLFVIISTVLYKKLKSPINEDSRRYLKWAKSTLVLVPLFGVNYAVFLIFYFLNEKIIWLTIDSLFGSFQGFFVAILYCFMNGEVKAELKPHINSILIFLATNNVTKFCFPRREKYLSSAAGRQSVCTTMSCSSLYNNGVNSLRNSKTKSEQLSKIKLTNLQAENQKEYFIPNGVRHSVPKTGQNGHFVPNLTFVHGRYPTTNADMSLINEIRPLHYSQNLPTCEEEVRMLDGENNLKNNLESNYDK